MIDLTPLDVRAKRGDFKRLMRGYDPQEVDTFLELVAERLEELTRETIALRERSQTLQQQVTSQTGREQAVQEALVTAQELRADIRGQAQREAESILKEAETEGRRLVAEAEAEARTKLRSSERRLDLLQDSLQEMERRRGRFLKEFRQLLERELDVVDVEDERKPLEERAIELELGIRRGREPIVSGGSQPKEPSPGARAALGLWEAGRQEREDLEFAPDSTPDEDEAASETPQAADAVPPPDAPIDELAAAYEQSFDGERPDERTTDRSSLSDALDGAPPAPKPPKQDNLMLYLDADEDS